MFYLIYLIYYFILREDLFVLYLISNLLYLFLFHIKWASTTNHGSVCSCVGPIIDAKMKCKVFDFEKFMIIQIRLVVQRYVFLPSVYDALLVIRPSCYFRDGRVIKNYTANFRQYFIELPFNDGYLFGLIHLIPANYRSTLHSFYSSMCKEVCDINVRDIILGFAPVFLFIKSYASFLVAELSQLCYKGVLRTIALGSTDGLCTWRCTFVMGLEPVIVGVGRIALGRIFNVVGSIIDRYMELSLSSQFNTTIPIDFGLFVESSSNLTYTLSYPNAILIFVYTKALKLNLIYLWNTMIMNTILKFWIYYIGCYYQLVISQIHQNVKYRTHESIINALPRFIESLF